ncbi:MAG: type II toxin-antitoxin system VapC family toxin [Thermoguttaceae bacterium]
MIVCDTHVILWMNSEPDRLSSWAKQEIAKADILCVSAITPWEIALLANKGRITPPYAVLDWLETLFNVPTIKIMPLTLPISVKSSQLQMHRDPADRIIVATAIDLECPLVSADGRIQQSGLVNVIW